jgi:predicted O-methyltransferase YrrM
MSTRPTPAARAAPAKVWQRVCREVARPFRRRTWLKWTGQKQALFELDQSRLLSFEFASGTVEPAGLEFLTKLVQLSQQYPGPIVEIGTLFGRTATHMALAKSPQQKIITVDAYCWNPWGLSQECHFQLTARMLHYLVASGQVEQRRMDKNEFYARYRGPAPALVFLDAAHSYEETRKDLVWAKAAGAALIAGHDYAPRYPGVIQAVDEFGGPQELGGSVFWLS